jgi:hypothetical protein
MERDPARAPAVFVPSSATSSFIVMTKRDQGDRSDRTTREALSQRCRTDRRRVGTRPRRGSGASCDSPPAKGAIPPASRPRAAAVCRPAARSCMGGPHGDSSSRPAARRAAHRRRSRTPLARHERVARGHPSRGPSGPRGSAYEPDGALTPRRRAWRRQSRLGMGAKWVSNTSSYPWLEGTRGDTIGGVHRRRRGHAEFGGHSRATSCLVVCTGSSTRS